MNLEFLQLGSNNCNKIIVFIHGWKGNKNSFESLPSIIKIPKSKWFFPQGPYEINSINKEFSWAFENPDGKSLTEIYNEGLVKTKNDIVLFCHDDLKFETRNWGRKLLNHFKRSSEYGIIGIAGTRYLAESGRWWEDFSKMHGAVYHEDNGKRWLTRYSKDIGNHLDDVILVDGLFFATTLIQPKLSGLI